MERAEVYRLIDEEREHQDARWGGRPHDEGHSPDDFLAFMDRYLLLAKPEEGKDFALTCVRKIAALAVACMEVHGAPPRYAPPSPAAGAP